MDSWTHGRTQDDDDDDDGDDVAGRYGNGTASTRATTSSTMASSSSSSGYGAVRSQGAHQRKTSLKLRVDTATDPQSGVRSAVNGHGHGHGHGYAAAATGGTSPSPMSPGTRGKRKLDSAGVAESPTSLWRPWHGWSTTTTMAGGKSPTRHKGKSVVGSLAAHARNASLESGSGLRFLTVSSSPKGKRPVVQSNEGPRESKGEKRWAWAILRLLLYAYALFCSISFSRQLTQKNLGLGDWKIGWHGFLQEPPPPPTMDMSLERGRPVVDIPTETDPATGAAASAQSATSLDTSMTPFTSFDQSYLLQKMHHKISPRRRQGLTLFWHKATGAIKKTSVTACGLWTETWLDDLPLFVQRWQAPVSAVVELAVENEQIEGVQLDRLRSILDLYPLLAQWTDIHLIVLRNASLQDHARLAAQIEPEGFHWNLARYFARTNYALMLNGLTFPTDTRLARTLARPELRAIYDAGNALLVPTIAFTVPENESRTGVDVEEVVMTLQMKDVDEAADAADADAVQGSAWKRPDVQRLRASTLASALEAGQEELAVSAHVYAQHRSARPRSARWPASKTDVVAQIHSRRGLDSLLLWDEGWEYNQGPTNYNIWKDRTLAEGPYPIEEYDFHWAANLVIRRDAPDVPWCSERTTAGGLTPGRSTCLYQMFLSGVKIHVLPEWFMVDLSPSTPVHGGLDVDRIESTIAERIRNKYHVEACMHYGRNFLSRGAWNDERAAQARFFCARDLHTWGLGVVV